MSLFDKFRNLTAPVRKQESRSAHKQHSAFRLARVEEPRPVLSEPQPIRVQAIDEPVEVSEEILNLKDLLELEDSLLELVDPKFAKEQLVLPVSREGNIVTIACVSKQSQMLAARALRAQHKALQFKFVYSTEEIICSAIDWHYLRRDLAGSKAREEKRYKQISSRIRQIETESAARKHLIFTDGNRVGDKDGALREFVELLLCSAHSAGATDVDPDHFFMNKKAASKAREVMTVRVRVDGDYQVLHEEEMEIEKYQRFVQILKILASCDPNNAWDGQSGVIRAALAYSARETTVEFRANFLPSGDGSGESISIRIQERENFQFTIENIGLLPFQLEMLRNEIVNLTDGLVAVCGSVNKGKNTSMVCITIEVQRTHPAKKIITLEDPPEFTLDYVKQIAVDRRRSESGEERGFSYYLKHILRHNPDVIVVGEVRDHDTAKTAVETAGIGHLLLTTMHTANSVEAINRLRNLKIEDYKIAGALKAVIAQRLVKRICPDCEHVPDIEAPRVPRLREYAAQIGWNREARFWKGSGKDREGRQCMTCRGTGFNGRTGVFEILTASRKIRSLIADGATPDEIRAQALKEGFRSLWSVGLEKALLGETALGQIIYHVGKPDPALEGLSDAEEISESETETVEMPAFNGEFGEVNDY